MTMQWKGVMPAITTGFKEDLGIDHDFFGRHCEWLLESGCTGIVTPGSLGEGATLTFDEKVALWRTSVTAVGNKVPVIAAISALSTADGVAQAKAAEKAGCRGLMVLPPYVYRGDWREMKAHVTAIMSATDLSCMLYNNPIAYGTDFLPTQIAELAEERKNFQAVKESSADIRRVTAIRTLLGNRLDILVGVDDMIVEAIVAGATGWIAGLVNALPRESVAVFDLASEGDMKGAWEIYRWFLPLLRMDTTVDFVQLIKLVQQEVGMGSARVRPPRLELSGKYLDETLAIIRGSLKNRPAMA
ncbi:MAG: dihydrodipicolinate synthase family protein [Acidobacteriota bacterium]